MLKGGFADFQHFGRFTFKQEPPKPEVYRRFLANAIGKEIEPLRKERQFILKGLNISRTKQEAGRLNEISSGEKS